MNPHEKACVEYVRAHEEVARLTTEIGISIFKCREEKAKAAGEDTEYSTIPHCLPDYYRDNRTSIDAGFGHVDFPDCQYCTNTDALIWERKLARRKLGAAKRQITVLGKKLVRESAT